MLYLLVCHVQFCILLKNSFLHMQHRTPMDGVSVLSKPHAIRALMELTDGPLKESQFGKVTKNYYTAHNVLSMLEEVGLVERFEIERSSANWYRLTSKGRDVTILLQRAVEVVEEL